MATQVIVIKAKVIKCSLQGDGTDHYINVSEISNFHPYEEGTHIVLKNGETLNVKEKPEFIMKEVSSF